MNSETMKYNPLKPTEIWFHIYLHQMVQIKKEVTNIWEYKIGSNANIANFVCLWEFVRIASLPYLLGARVFCKTS